MKPLQFHCRERESLNLGYRRIIELQDIMDSENIHKRLKEAIGDNNVNFSILEDKIDVELQMDFFDFIKKHKSKFRKFDDLVDITKNLFEKDVEIDEKKMIFAELSQCVEVEAYRVIEKYVKNNTDNLNEWAKLALQQCRMNLESDLLDEKQVFISTGLGGKENALRYFSVFFNKEQIPFSKTQKRILKTEIDYTFNNSNCTIEELNIEDTYVSLLVLIPLKADIKEIFDASLVEINKMGNFLSENYIITNVKKLNEKEILKAIEKKRNDDSNRDE
ncbi:MAG: hypothetical protein U9R54_07785 [Bacteroidota bacterium]|nr:hypothetical protein [Bacteroidota bacterium]